MEIPCINKVILSYLRVWGRRLTPPPAPAPGGADLLPRQPLPPGAQTYFGEVLCFCFFEIFK